MSSSNFGRRTWDRDQYLENRDKAGEEAQKISQEQLEQLKLKYTGNNDKLLNSQLHDINKRQFTGTSSAYQKQRKKIGFHCELCNLTFKDTVLFANHLNDMGHNIKYKKLFGEDLVQDKRNNDDIPIREFEQLLQKLKQQYDNNKREIMAKKTDKDGGKNYQINKNGNKVKKIMGFDKFR
ncbi:related to 23 kDa U4/U6.U5 small nuclear ribonucleoprotein component [Saccharomycodes ludwigii]|uniref:Related to 23 kDa U4/U6.U5 small nuclear ribonucleoprotein component n=1 Tax=Saccharomycodes ludwigii TaxID=36035 RepID=A0A376B574_9ASCO|nr:hypothetical protein SCDLUD_002665 [Saccharomycodes ludwigii]KAH3901181.1 hypothetical protein SCDLUD_002665 [Saccharomycodes ludwigii]SSD59838.1 related to 23 kDa U4/U6.U5 small nuclear ribonucleoprotein component [Saccharomycodes ludwigii]